MSCEAAARVTDDVVGSLATSRQAFGTDVVILMLHNALRRTGPMPQA